MQSMMWFTFRYAGLTAGGPDMYDLSDAQAEVRLSDGRVGHTLCDACVHTCMYCIHTAGGLKGSHFLSMLIALRD